jgi:hypothetical protein
MANWGNREGRLWPRWVTSKAWLKIYDLSLTKFFLLNEARNMTLRVRADFVNAFNFVNFQGPDANGSASAFGTISSAYPPRNIKLGLKLQF